MVSRRAFIATAATGVAGVAVQGPRASRLAHAQEPKRGGTLRLLQIEPAIGFNPALLSSQLSSASPLFFSHRPLGPPLRVVDRR
ncbi:MAG TPA: hypothetical protein VGT00_14410 [Methylomirabilota bacterium]|jgi:hypothetical protein|nr:hypothetical protein [Methylomirabilota bacterium]